jgi:hypothetical protein
MKRKPEPEPESEEIFVHRDSNKTTVCYLDHGESLGVPKALIGSMRFSTLGFFLKLLALPQKDVADMLRLYDKMEPQILEEWLGNLREAGYVFRRRRADGSWQYVISNKVLSDEDAAGEFAAQDRAIAEGKEGA